jgi:hypothetical protein
MVPYQLGTGDGRLAVKYSARGCSATSDPMPKKPGHDFLRDALRRSLQSGDAWGQRAAPNLRGGTINCPYWL